MATMTTNLGRSELEALLDLEDSVLRKCADLLRRQVPLSEWPPAVRVAFLVALQEKGESREAYKAHRTARHLRIDRERLLPAPEGVTSGDRRCAERIRADLPRLVKLGQGSYLTQAHQDGKLGFPSHTDQVTH